MIQGGTQENKSSQVNHSHGTRQRNLSANLSENETKTMHYTAFFKVEGSSLLPIWINWVYYMD
jgi:hypothetical protein